MISVISTVPIDFDFVKSYADGDGNNENHDNAFASDIDAAIKEIQDLKVDVNIENSQAKNITGIESNRDKGSFSATINGSVLYLFQQCA
jgi:hypothetical protein